MKTQTIPHSPVGYAIEAGVLNEQDAMAHSQRHIVSNLIGSHDVRIDLSRVLCFHGYCQSGGYRLA